MKYRICACVVLVLIKSSALSFDGSCKVADHPNDVFAVNARRTDVNPRKNSLDLISPPRRYLLYEVNPGEGFNLRRDVYLRVADLVRQLRERKPGDHWTLVLPSFGRLYHWKSEAIVSEYGKAKNRIPWSLFFEISSLEKYVPVVELDVFLEENGRRIGNVYSLQYFADTFAGDDDDFKWEEKYEESQCLETPAYRSDTARGDVTGWFWGYVGVGAEYFSCLSLQGQASTLVPFVQSRDVGSIMLDRAEVMLHDAFGGAEYWRARRSMRFAKPLRDAGDRFRREHLNSTDLADLTVLDEDWRRMRPSRGTAKGGPFVGVHLRREDFLHSRAEHVPSLKSAASQILQVLARHNLTKVFVATDAPKKDFDRLKQFLPHAVRYSPTIDEKMKYRDGGIAIIDQWICSHARHFIGTYESTFSFRIQEEREILGFHAETTFNRFCGDTERNCEQPAKWKIVY